MYTLQPLMDRTAIRCCCFFSFYYDLYQYETIIVQELQINSMQICIAQKLDRRKYNNSNI